MDINAQIQFFGELLVNKGAITKDQIKELKKSLKEDPSLKNKSFEDILIQKGFITEIKLLKVYGEYLDISYLNLDKQPVDPKVVSLIPAKFANKNKLIAVKKDDNNLTVTMRNPFDVSVIDELKTLTKLTIIPTISTLEDIQEAIKLHYGMGAETVEQLVSDNKASASTADLQTVTKIQDAQDETADASMVNYVNQLILEAYNDRATDIHIEPFKDRLRVRYRIDGVLHEAKTPQDINKLHVSIISRLKVMSNLNISEKRRPQDGRCKVSFNGTDLDLRLATYPTLFGEGMSIRLLTSSTELPELDKLGFSKEDEQTVKGFLKKPNGIILVTGPTGSGKSTTLYSCVNYINDPKIKIVTLEDPIEYQLDGINQIQVNPKADLTFANGFRSILRQDPDVILVGEIRDSETANIAIRAALTGHLILSTLHTNNALDTITRLLDLGVEPYLLNSTLRAVVAQRLVRRICDNCKEKHKPSKELLGMIGLKSTSSTFYQGRGCDQCNGTGYKGRLALIELLTIDEKLSNLIAKGDAKEELKRQAEVSGMKTLNEDGLKKIKEGITTLEEVIRVTE